MVGENSVGLLFRINSDSSQARGDMANLREVVTKEVSAIKTTGNKDVLNGLSSAFSQLTRDAGINIGALNPLVGQLKNAITGLINPIGLVTAGFGAFIGLIISTAQHREKLIKDALDYGSRLNDLSIKTGLAVETLSGLDSQAQESGTSIEKLSDGVFLLQKNVENGGPKVEALAKSFGITKDNVGDADGTLRRFFEGISKLPTEAERNSAGALLMGKSYKELSVLLADTHGNIDAVIQKAKEQGMVMSGEAAQAADRLSDAYERLENRVNALDREWATSRFSEVAMQLDIFTAALENNERMMKQWGITASDMEKPGAILRGILGIPVPGLDITTEDIEAAASKRHIEDITAIAEEAASKSKAKGNLPTGETLEEQATKVAAEAKKAAAEQRKDLKAASDARLEILKTEESAAKRIQQLQTEVADEAYKKGKLSKQQYTDSLVAIEDNYLTKLKSYIQRERDELEFQYEDERQRAARSRALDEQASQNRADHDRKIREYLAKVDEEERARAERNEQAKRERAKVSEDSRIADLKDQAERSQTAFYETEDRKRITFLKAEDAIIEIQAKSLAERKAALKESLAKEKEGTAEYEAINNDYLLIQEKSAAFKEEAERRKRAALLKTIELEDYATKKIQMDRLQGREGDTSKTGIKDQPNEPPENGPGPTGAEIFRNEKVTDYDLGKGKDSQAQDPIKRTVDALGELKAAGKDAFGSLASGFGSMVGAWASGANLGDHAMRKLIGSVLAGLAAQAATQALMFTAYGLVALSPWGQALGYGNPANWFAAAALMASVALGSGLAGRYLSQDKQQSSAVGSAAGGGASSSATSSGSTAPKPIEVNRPRATGGTSSDSSEHLAQAAADFRAAAADHLKAASLMNAAANRIYGTTAAEVVRAGAPGAVNEIAHAFSRDYQQNGVSRMTVTNDGMIAFP